MALLGNLPPPNAISTPITLSVLSVDWW